MDYETEDEKKALGEIIQKLPHQERIPLELLSRERLQNPWPWLEEMRENEPVRYDEYRDCWDVFTYEDVRRVMSDPESFERRASGGESAQQTFFTTNDRSEFDRLYDPVKPYLESQEYLGQYEPEIRQITRETLDRALRDGNELDFVTDFAEPIPFTVMVELLGVPRSDRAMLREGLDGMIPAPSLEPIEANDPEALLEDVIAEMTAMGRAIEDLEDYFYDFVEERRENPQDDMLSKIIHHEGAELTDEEIVGTAVVILFGGNVTTINFIPVSLWAFDRHGILQEVRDGEIDLESALEEVLRYYSIVKAVDKYAIRDVEIGGREISEGEQVFAWLGAANRQPEVFDDPNEFDPERSPNRHLTFSTGMHYCKGAPLARLMGRVVLETFFEEVDDIEILIDDPDPRVRNTEYGFDSLPISVTR